MFYTAKFPGAEYRIQADSPDEAACLAARTRYAGRLSHTAHVTARRIRKGAYKAVIAAIGMHDKDQLLGQFTIVL